jgi:hypothetical protein
MAEQLDGVDAAAFNGFVVGRGTRFVSAPYVRDIAEKSIRLSVSIS